MSCQKLVRCWNCKHLKTVYQGEPKGGKLFGEEFKRCDVHGTVLKYYDIVMERKCGDHVRFGLWEKPPEL